MQWIVKNFDINTDQLVDIDIIKHKIDKIKKLKKKCPNINEFATELKYVLMNQYWSRCEYEMLLYKKADRIYVCPWIGRDVYAHEVDITDFKDFDWIGFANKQFESLQHSATEVKIDVFDQLKYRWEELVNYIWTTRFPYERNNEKFQNNLTLDI